jgi:hypothetical protein
MTYQIPLGTLATPVICVVLLPDLALLAVRGYKPWKMELLCRSQVPCLTKSGDVEPAMGQRCALSAAAGMRT